MPIATCACTCGGSQTLVRNFLHKAGYPDWATIPVHQGKAKTISLIDSLPPYPELQALKNMLDKTGKWAVIIGWEGDVCRWSDISHNIAKSRIEAEYLVSFFGNPKLTK